MSYKNKTMPMPMPMSLSAALMQRVFATGDTSPGNWNFAADIVRICARHMDGWINRFDDAMRILDVLDEAADALGNEAVEQHKKNLAREQRFECDECGEPWN